MYTLKIQWKIMFLSLICIDISNRSSTTDFPDRKPKLLCCLTFWSKTQMTLAHSHTSISCSLSLTASYCSALLVLLSTFTQLYNSLSEVQCHAPLSPKFSPALVLKLEIRMSTSSNLEHLHLDNCSISCMQYLLCF